MSLIEQQNKDSLILAVRNFLNKRSNDIVHEGRLYTIVDVHSSVFILDDDLYMRVTEISPWKTVEILKLSDGIQYDYNAQKELVISSSHGDFCATIICSQI